MVPTSPAGPRGARAGTGSGSAPDPAAELDTPEFLNRLRARDSGAIAAVVDAYLEQIVRAARGAGLEPGHAEDVAQATFLTFLETLPRFEGRSRIRTWLFGILFRKVAEARRDRSRHEWEELDERFASRFDDGGGWVRPPREPDHALETRELGAAIAECLEAAPTRQRAAFTLREVERLSTEEICKILDVTVTNLGVMLHRVRNRLRECLEAKGIDP